MLGLRPSLVRHAVRRPWTSVSPQRNLWQSLARRSEPIAPHAQPAFFSQSDSFVARTGNPSIRNQVLFFIFGSSAAFTYAAWYTNLRTDELTQRLQSGSTRWLGVALTSLDLRRYEQAEIVKSARLTYTRIMTDFTLIPAYLRPLIGTAYATVCQPWVDISEGKRIFWKIILLNLGVYAAWKIPSLQTAMWKNFTHSPLSGKSFTLLTSTFSHMGLMHLFFNCYALDGFGSTAAIHLSREQGHTSELLESSPAYHALAFYCSAGIFASLVSHIVSAKVRYPSLIKSLTSTPASAARPLNWNTVVASSSAPASSSAFRTALGLKSASTQQAVKDTLVPSLGASGAVYACLTMTALAFPEAKVALMIPPSFPLDIQYGVTGLVLLDVVGALRGWRMFDHCAHLGGAAFGVAYFYYGVPLWNGLRETLSTSNKS